MKIAQTPPWRDDITPLHFKPLTTDMAVDVLIIGGGITGIATAYELSKKNKSVMLIEQEILGSGATNHTTAFLGQIIDTDLKALVEMYGEKGAKIVWASGGKAIDLIEKNITKEKLHCAFNRCSYYEFSLDKKDDESLKEEAALAKKLGFSVVFHKDTDLGWNPHGYNEVKYQGKFHPLKYIYGLAHTLEKKGAQIFEHTKALEIENTNPLKVTTTHGTITAHQVIVTTYAPFMNKWEHFFKSAYYEDFMMELHVPKEKLQEALYADTNNPYTYFRIDPKASFDRMIIGGLTHRIQIPMDEEKGYKALEVWLQKLIPDLTYTIVRKWRGTLIEPDDGIAYIGKLTGYDEVYVATGFSGNGMTYAHIAAMIFSDLVRGKKNEWEELYNAQRIPNMKSLIQKGKDYSGTLIGGLRQNLHADATK